MNNRVLEQPHEDIGKLTLSFLRFFNFRKNVSANKNMFDELKQINIQTCSETELKILVQKTLPILDFHTKVMKELLSRKDDLNEVTTNKICDSLKVAISNGRKLSEQEFQNINEDDFHIILDITTNSLRFKKNPSNDTTFEKSKLENIGPRRIEVLMYLLEHPNRDISIDNVSKLPMQCDIVEPNTLVKTISILRKSVGQNGSKGPYIITKTIWGKSFHSVYQMNEAWKYLVIK